MRRLAWAGVAAALLLAAGLRAGLAARRYYDTDELEHLHAALLVAHGAVPFRDFFEHHGPLFWAALAPAAAVPAGSYGKAMTGRAAMCLFWAATLLLTARPRAGGDPLEGALAAAWLASFWAFSRSSLEIRPDVPAAALVLAAAVVSSRGGARAGLWAGALLGLAGWCTPKAVPPAAALIAAAVWRRAPRERRRFAIEAAGAGGAVAAVGIAYFAARGAAGALWSHYVVYNAGFPRAPIVWSFTLAPSLARDPLAWALGLLGLRRARSRPEEASALAASLAGLALGPSGYPQSLLFAAPFLLRSAAGELAALIRPSPRRALAAAAALALIWGAGARESWALVGAGNALQRQRWACADLLPADARVWDVWTGDAFARPHAARLWFVPEDSQAYYEPAALEAQLVGALAAPGTAAAVRCESCLARLPAGVTKAFDRSFAPSGCGRLWLRKEGA